MARILIADDDADIRQLLMYSLVDEGHEVAVARDGAEALEALLALPPDLVVLDLMMPGMDGFRVLEDASAAGLRDAIRVLVLTARGSDHDWERAFELGADAYMTKPFDPDELAGAVKDLLDCSVEELRARREHELDKSRLLSQLESLFGES